MANAERNKGSLSAGEACPQGKPIGKVSLTAGSETEQSTSLS
jgi:hypothetical protein